ncbi:Hypothetical protein POVN_LOCUS577 [uncultured virus]|nr:Hypothetical protein POVN_LOCUS577 [uncultured virus]
MKFVTVATHGERYFTSLQDSCKKYGCELVTLGWGQKWGGFAWRLTLMQDYLKTQNPDEIIMFIDAFDAVILSPPAVIEERFRNLNVPMVFSTEKPYLNIFMRYLHRRMYPFKGTLLCAGVYMGYASNLLQFIQSFHNGVIKHDPDDQRMLACFANKFPTLTYADTKSSIFLNIHGGSRCNPDLELFSIKNNQYFRFVDQKDEKGDTKRVIRTVEGEYPCILHGPGNVDMDSIVKELGLVAPLPAQRKKEGRNYFLRNGMHFLPYFKVELFVLCLLLFLLCLYLFYF